MTRQHPRLLVASATVLAALIMAFANAKALTLLAWLALLLGAGILAAAAFTMRPAVVGGAILLSALVLALVPITTDGSVVSLGILPILAGGVLGGRLRRSGRGVGAP